MLRIRDTRVEMIQLVLPEHANILGGLYGGRLMYWLTTASSMAASRVARGPAVLGSMDDIDFINPIKIGEIVIFNAQVEYVGRSSMEVGIVVHSENPQTGEKKITTSSHMAYVAVDSEGRPRGIPQKIEPAPDEIDIYESAVKRREERLKRLQKKKEDTMRVKELLNVETQYRVSVSKIVMPEDATFGRLMFAGKLMLELDQLAAILAIRYARGPVVTASLDAMDFYSPLRVGDIMTMNAYLNYVGHTSMEIGVNIFGENPAKNKLNHTSTAFMTFVHIDENFRPAPLKPYTPHSEFEKKLWQEAEERKKARAQRREELKKLLKSLGYM